MKKSLCVMLVLVVAALATFPAAVLKVNGEKENIVITEEVVSGNPREAEGVTLQVATHWEGQLLWNTEYVIGSGEPASSTFDFAPNAVRWTGKGREYISLEIITGFGTALSGGTSVQHGVDVESMWMSEVLTAVAERTAAGEKHKETVNLRDYYEYYPISFDMRSESLGIAYYEQMEDLFTDYFHIEVPDGHLLEVEIEKNEAGAVISVHCNSVEGGSYTSEAAAFGENGCIFAYNCESRDKGEVLDLGQNDGFFYIPYEKAEEKTSYSNRMTVYPERIEKVAELPGAVDLEELIWDEEAGRLYLAAKGDGEYCLYIYKMEDKTPVLTQKITVLSGEDLPYWYQMTLEEGGILMKWKDNRFAFVTEKEGEYQLWCSGVFPSDTLEEDGYFKNDAFRWEHACLFDGERLVLAGYENSRSVNVQLAVYRPQGQSYFGIYGHSGYLDKYMGGMSGMIAPQGGGAGSTRGSGEQLILRWSKE